MNLVLFVCALCAVFIGESSAEVGFVQDTYLNALQNSHTQDIEHNNGYEYSPPPNNKYLPPPQTYGVPHTVYGPPSYKPIVIASQPRDDWFWNKLKTKINLFTIGKIVLKLLIFKKIVKFIGLICLLLFLPKLKDMFKGDMMMDEDGLMDSKILKTEKDVLATQIDEIYKFALKSFETYSETGNQEA